MEFEEYCSFRLDAEDVVVQSFCIIPESPQASQNTIQALELLLACSNGELCHLCLTESQFSSPSSSADSDRMDVDSGPQSNTTSSKIESNHQKWKPAFCLPILKDVYALQTCYCVSTQKFVFGCAGGLGKEIQVAVMPHGAFFQRVATIPVKSPISDIFILSDTASSSPGDNGAHRWTCTLIFSGEDKRIHLWMIHWTFSPDFSSAEYQIANKRTYSGPGGYIRSISINSSLSSNDRLELLAAGSDDGTCRSWPIQSVADLAESTTETSHIDSVLTVDFKANILASGSKDYSINIVDVPMHQQAAAASRKHSSAVDAIGRFRLQTPAVVRSLVVRQKSVFSISLAFPTSQDHESCAILRRFLRPFMRCHLVLSDDGTILICGGGDGALRAWQRRATNTESSKEPSTHWVPLQSGSKAHDASVFKISARGTWLVSCGADHCVKLFSIKTK